VGLFVYWIEGAIESILGPIARPLWRDLRSALSPVEMGSNQQENLHPKFWVHDRRIIAVEDPRASLSIAIAFFAEWDFQAVPQHE
jgi:hypothetical protein